MNSSKLSVFLTALGFSALQACSGGVGSSGGGGGSGTSSQGQGVPVAPVHFSASSYPTIGSSTGNTITLGVNDSTQCGSNANSMDNLPCVTVTICAINSPTTCQTINNILLDTGSYGLRIFQSVINSSVLSGMVPVTNGANQLGECVLYGDGSSDWGPVEYAYVKLGNEPKVGIPIQVINSQFQNPPSICQSPNSTPDVSPETFNGILGVGYLAQDCGSYCVTHTDQGGYFTCLNGSCNSGSGNDAQGGASVDLGAQVINPVAALPTDNNGVIVSLPSVGASGTISVTGTLTFGIGTSSSVPTTPKIFPVQSYAQVSTAAWQNGDGFISMLGSSFSSNSANWLPGFLDTGSNFLYFDDSAVAKCSSGTYQDFYCPSSTASVSVTISSNKLGTTTSTPVLSLANAQTVLGANPSSNVFSNIGMSLGNSGALTGVMDLGLPFFYGQTIYVGINGTNAPAVSASGAFFGF